ncbi:MAG: MFS transporter [Maritimibacter sp.]|nr:MFS transporter [Maritimibacter sp.]
MAASLPSAAQLRARILGVFALHAATAGALVARVPDIQLRLGLDEAALGALLTTSAVGALPIYLVSGKLIARFGTHRTALVTLIGSNLAAALLATAPGLASAFAASFVQGGLFTLANIAINVEADRIEAATGRRVMNTCHGVWSLALLAVSTLAAGLRGALVGVGPHLWAHGALVSLVALWLIWGMRPQAPREGAGTALRARFAWPTAATLGIVAFGFGGDLVHGAARSWAIIFLRDTFDVARLVEGLAFPAFVLAMTLARLGADRWLARHSVVRVARAHAALSIVGVVALVASPTPAVALVALAAIGAGVGPVYPMMISAAAQIGDRPAADNVAAMTLVVQVLMLGAPLLVGTLAEAFSLRIAFASFLPLLVLGFIAARALER